MKKNTFLPFVVTCCLAAFGSVGRAEPVLDLSSVEAGNAGALKAAVEAAGGTVSGEPIVAVEPGPNGKEEKMISFPGPECTIWVPTKNLDKGSAYEVSAQISVDVMPWGKAGGVIFGILFDKNGPVLALGADRWSKADAVWLRTGNALLLRADVLTEQFPTVGMWQRVTLGFDGMDWRLALGSDFEKKGSAVDVQDERKGLSRNPPYMICFGCFTGRITVPTVTVR
ncbi:MAG: hypothetical protein WCH98_05215 [Verrucomicrobiota bacterium]